MAVNKDRLRIATRGSKLALAQAGEVADELAARWPGLEVSLEVVRTEGDAVVDRPVAALGQGAFVTEVRRAVQERRADLAVHSYKDLPTDRVPGLTVAAVPQRIDPRDVLVSRRGVTFTYLHEGAVIGTASARRTAQILRRRGDLVVQDMRGNVDSRLAKLQAGEVDALVLAAAGLIRLGQRSVISEYIDSDIMIPAPAQGALALEIRSDDADTAELVAPLNEPLSAFAVLAERTCLAGLGGGCNKPIGIFANTDRETIFIHGVVATPDGSRAARLRWTGPFRQAEDVGSTLAELLLAAGAREILAGVPIPPTTRYAAKRRSVQAAEDEADWDEPYPWDEA